MNAMCILQAQHDLIAAAIRFVQVERRIAQMRPDDFVHDLMAEYNESLSKLYEAVDTYTGLQPYLHKQEV